MPTIITRGAASAQALGYAAPSEAGSTYVEDVFSTHLYTGNGATQTITNNIDLSGDGGMVWIKSRSAATNNFLFDTSRGALNEMNSNTTEAQTSLDASLTAFNATGFDVGAAAGINVNAATYASWAFRKQAKFFDIVTYTGTGANRTIAHNLGSAPGCIIVKQTDGVNHWAVYHRGMGAGSLKQLNSTVAATVNATVWNNTAPTDAVFSVGTNVTVNASGGSYIAYLFAHDAGGFGLNETDNIISCGSFTTDSGGAASVTLGYEPQLLLFSRTNATGPWYIIDTMRGYSYGLFSSIYANTAAAEVATSTTSIFPTATGFGFLTSSLALNASYIYITIRRGPMKVPTDATKVFGVNARTGTGANATVTGVQVGDLAIIKNLGAVQSAIVANRLTNTNYMSTAALNAETAAATTILQANPWDVMDGVKVGTTSAITNAGANTFINYLLRRAPQFYDSLSYTFPATLVATRIPHNLAAPPEMIIAKSRTGGYGWYVYHKDMGLNAYVRINAVTNAVTSTAMWGTTAPTSTDFGLNPVAVVAVGNAQAMVHLFATCPGVSKVGGYTGTTSTVKQIDCGFTTGARFVLIKTRSGVAGDWYLWDSARGITSGNDPYFLLNTTAAEVTGTDYINATSTGFEITAAAPTAINGTGSNYIFLAIA